MTVQLRHIQSVHTMHSGELHRNIVTLRVTTSSLFSFDTAKILMMQWSLLQTHCRCMWQLLNLCFYKQHITDKYETEVAKVEKRWKLMCCSHPKTHWNYNMQLVGTYTSTKYVLAHTCICVYVFICVYICGSKVDYYNFTNDYVLKDMKLNRNILNNTKG